MSGVKLSHTVIHHGIHKDDPQLSYGVSPNRIAGNETANEFGSKGVCLNGAVDPRKIESLYTDAFSFLNHQFIMIITR